MSIEEQRRAKFESAYQRPDGVVWNSMTADYWEGWQEMGDDRAEEISAYNERWKTWNAALDSVAIELPSRKYIGNCGDDYYDAPSVERAIEEAGLKVKP